MSVQPIRPQLKVAALLSLLGMAAFAFATLTVTHGERAPGAEDRERLEGSARAHVAAGRREASHRAGPYRDSSGAAPTRRDADPQLRASRLSLARALDMGAPAQGPETHRLDLERAEGLAMEPGASCELRVLPVRVPGFDCLVAVRCGGRVIYPDPELGAGYARCEGWGPTLTVLDDGTTGQDGDPMLRVDLGRGLVEVRDAGPGAFHARLRRVGPLPRI